jgi:hypothetical protein
MIETLNNIQSIFTLDPAHYKKLENFYPLISKTIVPLSYTGVSPRIFHAWKENGLIDLTMLKKEDENGRKWIRLNLYEYVWVKIIQYMRDFGLSYEIIKMAKSTLESKLYDVILHEIDTIMEIWKIKNNPTKAEYLETKESLLKFSDVMAIVYDIDDPYEQQKTSLYNLIVSTFAMEINSSIVIYKDNDSFKLEVVCYHKDFLASSVFESIKKPHFEIPLLDIVENFFGQPKSEEYAEKLGLYDLKELQLLETIKKKNFKEIKIQYNKNNELMVEVIKDGSITDEKAYQIRKILGLNLYEEITLTYRNDKNLYFRNKKRLDQ